MDVTVDKRSDESKVVHPALNPRSRATWDSVQRRKPAFSARYYIIRAIMMILALAAVLYTRSRMGVGP